MLGMTQAARRVKHALLALVLVSCASSDPGGPAENSIAAGKRSSVRTFDRSLPDTPVEAWLRSLPGARKVVWESNDCGEQTGSGDPDPEFPICAEADVAMADGRTVIVMIVTGMYPRPLTHAVELWGAFIRGADGKIREVRPLSALPAALREPAAAQ